MDEHGNVVGIVTAALNQVGVQRSSGTVPQKVNDAEGSVFLVAVRPAD